MADLADHATSETAAAAPGLTSAEVLARRARDGWNELPSTHRRGLLANVLALVREPMTLLLLVCGGIYMAVGDSREGFMLLGFVVFIVALTLFQERKTERALEALGDLASPRALVVRDGERIRVAGRELVEGDLVVLAEGDRVPADARVAEGSHLAADESLVTGESVPVRKSVWDGLLAVARPGGEDLPFVYAGTLVTSGAGVARVYATGPRTEIERPVSPLRRRFGPRMPHKHTRGGQRGQDQQHERAAAHGLAPGASSVTVQARARTSKVGSRSSGCDSCWTVSGSDTAVVPGRRPRDVRPRATRP
jgi:magnesium-transporting ATPase (P-type)